MRRFNESDNTKLFCYKFYYYLPHMSAIYKYLWVTNVAIPLNARFRHSDLPQLSQRFLELNKDGVEDNTIAATNYFKMLRYWVK